MDGALAGALLCCGPVLLRAAVIGPRCPSCPPSWRSGNVGCFFVEPQVNLEPEAVPRQGRHDGELAAFTGWKHSRLQESQRSEAHPRDSELNKAVIQPTFFNRMFSQFEFRFKKPVITGGRTDGQAQVSRAT